MSNVLFKLRVRSEKAKEASICLEYYFDRKHRLSYPTGLKCDPKIWDSKKQEIRNLVSATSKDVINKALRSLKSEVEAWITKQKIERDTPTPESLRAFLDNKIKPKKPNPKLGANAGEVDAFFSDFIDNADKRTDPKTGRKVGQSTLYSYKRAFEYLKEFEKQQRKLLKFSDIGLMFYRDYMAFLQAKNLSTNTCGREIKTLRIFINEAAIQGKDINKEYFRKGTFVVTKEEADNISLTKEELHRLYALNLEKSPTLDRVRDVFLVGCYTGLRYSDYSMLTSKDIYGDVIKLRMEKTDGSVVIPLHPIVKAILEKHNGILPKSRRTGKPMTSQKFNKYLRIVCNTVMDDGKICIYGTESKRITKGGVKIIMTKQRADMVSSHTARRTFATLNYLDEKIDTLTLMRITGHKTEAAFLKYIKVSNEESARRMAEVWRRNGEYITLAK